MFQNTSDCWNYNDEYNCSSLVRLVASNAAQESISISAVSYAAVTAILCASTMLATPANILVIWVVVKTPFLRAKAVNMLIVNLCLIDLIASCFDLPLVWIILQLRFNRISEHRWICSWQLFIHTMSISGQILSFVSVGYERYHTVSNPFDKEKVRRITHFLVVSCWLIGMMIAFLETNLTPDTVGYVFCAQSGRTKHLGIIYIMLPFGTICFLAVAFFYCRIVWLVRKHCKTVNTTCRKLPIALGNGTDISNGSELPSIYGDVCVLDSKNRSLGKRRIEAETAKKSFFVIISFLAFTLPYPLLVLIEKIFNLAHHRSIYELQYCFNIMSLLSSGLNPLVYGLANKQFRNAFRKICHRYYRRYKSREYL